MKSLSDVGYPRLLLLILTVAIVGGLLFAISTSTAAFSSYSMKWNGAAELHSVASNAGAESKIVQDTSDYADVDPNDTIAVVISPIIEYGPTERSRVKKFVRNGGTLIVAEDFGGHSNSLLRSIGANARIDGRLVRDVQFNYRSPAMPVIRNTSNHRLTKGVDTLTFNYGTAVRPHDSTVLATTSDYAYLDTNQNQKLDTNESLTATPVASTERVGKGRVIVIGDPSLFINAMIDQSDNRAFVHHIFERHQVVMLDYSHSARLPPLVRAVMMLRTSPPLQILLGIIGVLGFAGWARRPRQWISELYRNSPEQDTPEISEKELVDYIEKHHPEWDSQRIERVVAALHEHRE
ncbi:DUF4350 domain-containing protein [Haladaptatus sp. NG-WS-4]